MGYEFDDNGHFIGWSSLFKTDTIDHIKQSEKLPTPDGSTIKWDNINGEDRTEDIINILSNNYSPESYAELLTKLGDQKSDYSEDTENKLIKVDPITVAAYLRDSGNDETKANDLIEKVVRFLNTHTQYKIPDNLKEAAFKNSVSARISQIILSMKNLDSAHSPIEMDAPQAAASESALGEVSSRITLSNPASVYVMQVQNMVGKNVIGVAAVGAKVFFANCYYFNECMRNGDMDWMRNAYFQRVYKRIYGRSSGEIKPKMVNMVANVNFDGVLDNMNVYEEMIKKGVELEYSGTKLLEYFKQQVQEQFGLQEDQSLIISALLSSATD